MGLLKVKNPRLKEKMWYVSGFVGFKVGCVHARDAREDPCGVGEKIKECL